MSEFARSEIVRQLGERPIVARSSPRAAVRAGLRIGIVLGAYSSLIVAAALVATTELGRAGSLLVAAGFATLIVVALTLLCRRNSCGWEYVFDSQGVTCSRFGVRHWSVPWDAFRLEGYGLMGSRARIALPDGRRIRFGEQFFELEDLKAVRSVFAAFEIEKTKRATSWLRTGAVAVVGGAGGFWAIEAARGPLFEAIDSGRPWPVVSIVLIVLGAIGVAAMMLSLVLACARLESSSQRWKGSKHGPLWIDYVRSHLRSVPAIEMQPGVKYKYLDPDRLKGHIGVGWAIAFCGGLLFAVSWLPSETQVDTAVWIIRAFALALIAAPIPSIRRDRALARTLGFDYWVEGGRLHVSDGMRTETFPNVPVRSARGNPDARVPKFMVWWEEYANERGRIRLDRRFLWPVE